jgi:hypothetical protein
MSYQVLQGVRITPKGAYYAGRFTNTFQGGAWPNSFAFGGWIYNASCDIGFSNQPTEIKISVVLEAKNKAQISAAFDINKTDIKCGAGDGADENLFDIDFNGVTFTDFILHTYEISIENASKILTVTFKDYSIILDKIYVGLLKRQGNKHTYTATSLISFPVNCPDCLLNGNSFSDMGGAYRDINYGSYVGINGKTYDNFAGILLGGNIYQQWQKLFLEPAANIKFDLNGGYLILGTEGVSEERCGDLANVNYNFNELLASLRFRGLSFDGAFPRTITDSDFIYKQNYIGTLREVLQQWCSDLGYDFYCEGKKFVGINLNRAIDISKIAEVADPNTELGNNFALNQNTAILSFKEVNSAANSYRQSVVTANTRPRQSKTHSKTPKRYVGFTPMHPIDFNIPSTRLITRQDIFGFNYQDKAWINSFNPSSSDLDKTLYQLDNRTFQDVDSAIALSHFDADLRDIYCQDRALYGGTKAIRDSNFRALGMYPLIEVTGEDKAFAIESVLSAGGGDEVSNICLDGRFYKVYIGYYYPKLKDDIVSWEQEAAQSMYKFGAVTKGIIRGLPYMPRDIIWDQSPAAGLYGSYGTSVTRIRHNFEPNAAQYYDLYSAPFKDLVLYSGFKNSGDYFPLDFYIGEISNDWGTTQENFKRSLSIQIDDECFQEYKNDPSFTDINLNSDKKYQDWRLNLFKPQVISNIDEFFDEFQGAFDKISGSASIDRTVQKYYDINYRLTNTCAKLQIFVLTDTRAHPNITVQFTSRGKEFVNQVVLQKYLQNEIEAIKRRATIKTQSVCEKTLLQEMCDTLLLNKSQTFERDAKYACAMQDEYNAFEEGFDFSYLSSPNSRGLDISITKNPVQNNKNDTLNKLFQNSDANGEFYYIDLVEGFRDFTPQKANITIVYPVSVEATDNIYYKGILTSDIEIENRCPETVEIFGEPPTKTNNSAAGVKVINNTIDPDLQPQLDPFSSRFISYITVVTGDNQIVTSVSGYHNIVQQLNNYEITGATKTIELSLAGTPDFFGSFKNYLSPSFGLNKMSVGVTDNGVVTSLSFADRPPQPPKQESILNKIGPRLKK